MPPESREHIRQAIVDGASRMRIAERVVIWCKANCPTYAIPHAATTQLVAILGCSLPEARALALEFFVV